MEKSTWYKIIFGVTIFVAVLAILYFTVWYKTEKEEIDALIDEEFNILAREGNTSIMQPYVPQEEPREEPVAAIDATHGGFSPPKQTAEGFRPRGVTFSDTPDVREFASEHPAMRVGQSAPTRVEDLL